VKGEEEGGRIKVKGERTKAKGERRKRELKAESSKLKENTTDHRHSATEKLKVQPTLESQQAKRLTMHGKNEELGYRGKEVPGFFLGATIDCDSSLSSEIWGQPRDALKRIEIYKE
jgi:hypothetical protein